MERKLHLLDSFAARGADGQTYKVCAYEHLVKDMSLPTDPTEHWESSGEVEYRLDSGASVEELSDGRFRVRGSELALTPVGRSH